MEAQTRRHLWRGVGVYMLFGISWMAASDLFAGLASEVGVGLQFFHAAAGVVFVFLSAVFWGLWGSRLLHHQATAQESREMRREQFESLLHNLPGAVYRCTLEQDRVFVFLSDGCSELTGYPATALMEGRPTGFSSLISPSHQSYVKEILQQALTRGGSYELCYPIRHADGTKRWIWEVGKVSTDPVGGPRLEGFLLDVTEEEHERQQARDESRQVLAFNELLTTILETSPVMTVLIGSDGRVRWVNRAFERTFRCDLSEVTGQPWLDVIPSESATHAGVRRLVEEVPGRWISLLTSNRQGEKLYTRWMHSSLSDGSHILIGIDLTTEVHAEKLRRRLFEQSIDLMAILDMDGYFREANPAWSRILGLAPERLPRAHFADLIGTPARSAVVAVLERVRRGEAVENFETTMTVPEGKHRFILWNLLPVQEDAAILTVGRDITRQRRLEEQFRQAQKMESIGRLAGGIAHDFNNLLTVIMGYAELGLAKSSDDNPQSRTLREILDASRRAAALTRKLLLFSRRGSTEPKIIRLNEHLRGMEEILRRVLGEDIQIRFHLRPDVGFVRIDPGGLEQALMNLVVNARDAMPNGGSLTISTDRQRFPPGDPQLPPHLHPGDYCILWVQDTGVGMAKEIQEHIFDPFFTTKPREQGTGLGLSTVYGIISQAGGTVTVWSEPGRGARFSLYLPAASPSETSDRLTTEVEKIDSDEGTVLLVEDDPAVREVLEHLLKELNLEVLCASNAREAWRVFEASEGRLDVLITDVILPHGTGPQLAEQILTRRPDLPVLFLSGYTGEALDLRGVKIEQGQAFLQKPFDRQTLAAKLRDLRNRKKRLN